MEENLEDYVQDLSDEELATLSGGDIVRYCPKGTFKNCEWVDGVRKCRCEPLYSRNEPME